MKPEELNEIRSTFLNSDDEKSEIIRKLLNHIDKLEADWKIHYCLCFILHQNFRKSISEHVTDAQKPNGEMKIMIIVYLKDIGGVTNTVIP